MVGSARPTGYGLRAQLLPRFARPRSLQGLLARHNVAAVTVDDQQAAKAGGGALEQATARVEELTKDIGELVETWTLGPLATALVSERGTAARPDFHSTKRLRSWSWLTFSSRLRT
jgi:hypothetical protein